MPDYTLNRNFTLRSTKGHILNFKKGVPMYVPPELERDVVAIGGEPVSGEAPAVVDDELEKIAPAAPSGDERESKILAAFAALVKRNAREDFSASGIPNTRALREALGFSVDVKERDRLWIEYRERDAA